ncbi:hypothetical protein CBR_g12948 [Chara braunii]|uniref:Integrase catalytic domain-containing protein n=1 Tax=Chara braunii TaxID=69332 RepID=A0A388KT40_CHABU|nr:hypothetical protein CBR_g12948 [Chara braunii]|eukprot:GBG73231.1 hypothetical protein CBR_g12948 [Chara braunii]
MKMIAEEQAAKNKKLETEMQRLQQEEEERMGAAKEEEVEEEEEQPEEEPLRRRKLGEGEGSSGTKEDDPWVERRISEWVANLSLGEDEEAMLYIPQQEKEAAIREIEATSDPLEHQALENEKRRTEESNKMAENCMDQQPGETTKAYEALMLDMVAEFKQRAAATTSACKKEDEEAEEQHRLAEQQQQADAEAARKAVDDRRRQRRDKLLECEGDIEVIANEWAVAAEEGAPSAVRGLASTIEHMSDLVATCAAQQEDILCVDTLELATASPAGPSNLTDRVNVLEIDIETLKDGALTTNQRIDQQICAAAASPTATNREGIPKFDGLPIFCDATKTDPIPWWRQFELKLDIHHVINPNRHAYLYSRSGGACQAWLDNMLSRHNVEVFELHTKISWADLKAAWNKRFRAESPEPLYDHLHTFLAFYAPPSSSTDDEVALGGILGYVTKVAREFRMQRYDDNNAPLFYVRIQVGQASSSALLDSSATRNFISQSFIQRAGLGAQVRKKPNPTAIKLADDQTQQLLDRYIEVVSVYFAPHACEPVTFDVLDTDFDIILGMPLLASADHTVNFHQRTLTVRDAFDTEVSCTIPLPHSSIRCQVVTAKSFRATFAYGRTYEIGLCFLRVATTTKSSPTDLSSDSRVVRLLDEFTDIFKSPTGVVPDRSISHEIILEAGAAPPKGCIYCMSEEELAVLRAQLDDLLDKGLIHPSSSPYGAPVLFVRKKNKDLRLGIDYLKLNAQTVKNAGRIDDLLERLGGAKFFSKLDLKSGYHQISIRPQHCYKSTFKTRYGHFELIVMPFGLTNAPTTFQAAMTNEFRPMLDRVRTIVPQSTQLLRFTTTCGTASFVATKSTPSFATSTQIAPLLIEGYLLVRTRLLGEFHDAPATGHFGVNRTIGRLRERVWWPGLLDDVTRYCELCEVCRRCKSRNHRLYGELRPLQVPLRRREAIAIDITGPFPKHKIGVDGILTVVDRLTKFAMFLPCRYHAKAPELAEVLYADWIRTKGYPKEIACDRDTWFMSEFWLALIKRWGSSLKPSSARHPQTDGQTERAHHTAQVLLRTLIRPDQKDWVERLPNVELAYNSSIHPAIRMSPFEFEHGSPVTSPLDTIIPRTTESDDHLLFLRRMQELLVKACDQMAKTQQHMSQQANRQHLPCPFRVGELVWVSTTEFSLEQDISRKLLPKWTGPWPIVAAAGDAPEGPSFTIQVAAHLPIYLVFHCSKLALYTPVEHDDFPRR